MKVAIKAVYRNGVIAPVDYTRLQEFKTHLKDGEMVELVFLQTADSLSEKSFRYFHYLRDLYAEAICENKAWAKAQLKYDWGVWVPYGPDFEVPSWTGKFYEMYNSIVFMKTTTAYTVKEMSYLIEGTKQYCVEAGVDPQRLEVPDEC